MVVSKPEPGVEDHMNANKRHCQPVAVAQICGYATLRIARACSSVHVASCMAESSSESEVERKLAWPTEKRKKSKLEKKSRHSKKVDAFCAQVLFRNFLRRPRLRRRMLRAQQCQRLPRRTTRQRTWTT